MQIKKEDQYKLWLACSDNKLDDATLKKKSRILLDIYPEKKKNTHLKGSAHLNVHSSAFYSSQDMEAT